MVRIGDMGFTRSKRIILFALVSFLQQSEVISSLVTPLGPGKDGKTNPPCAVGSDVKAYEINIPQIQVCFDYKNQGAIWTYHKIDGKNLKKAKGLKRKDNWRTDGLDNDIIQNSALLNPTEKLYQEVYKKETQLKGASEPKEYLARGHLSPNADFASQVKRDETSYFINAAPQWQYFNNGAWRTLEKAIREYAEKGQGKTLHVITGTDGILTDNGGDWYLTWQEKNAKNQKKIPVPKFFWKIVYDGNEGVAFVGSNEDIRNLGQGKNQPGKRPHPNAGNPGIPKDRCPQMYGDVTKGYIWCYTIQEIFQVLPRLTTHGYEFPFQQAMRNNVNLPDNDDLKLKPPKIGK